jgi:Concanavalin A-like lectin/glucanases superfamily
VDSDGNNIQVPSPTGTLLTGEWQHVAVTYDRKSGLISLYVNGMLVNQRAWSHFTPLTTGPIWISRRPNDHPGDWTYNAFFSGLLDQLAIYDRALSADEIKSICTQDNHGEMPPPPPTSAPATFEPMNGVDHNGNRVPWPGPASSPPGKIPDGG